MPGPFRVAVIGSTGKGDYGHGLDTAFQGVEGATVVAVADENAAGRDRAARKLGVSRAYADYGRMLKRERLDIVCVAPRWHDERVAMVTAAAKVGCHIYCEKPFAPTVEAADAMVAAIREAGVTLAMAHQWRAMAPVQRLIQEVRGEKHGRLLRITARPKDDRRGGGEELPLHGTHLFDIMLAMAGPPRWVSGHIQQRGRDVVQQDRREATEPIGPVAGDAIDAVYGFDNGVRGYFMSTANLAVDQERGFDNLFGLVIECEKRRIQLRAPGDAFLYAAPVVLADQEQLEWEKVWIEEWHFTPEHQPRPLR
ncbi:MAG: Gfo/Idh/MocA family oxidoreductase, partial [Pirellulaceae bacterium]|nr:Gfo/Idh/MocA family oxidoreductase [Pirellulaceae bacterium]